MNKKNLLFILLILISVYGFCYTGEVVKKISCPAKHSTGLTFDGKNLWMADRETDKIYCIDPATGNVLRHIESPAYWPMGLAWDGTNLWNADIRGRSDIAENYDGMIHKIDPETGNILKTLQAPSTCPRGLAWDGKYLWCCDNRSDKIIQFSTKDGTTINSFPSPSSNPRGITFDGKYLWVSDPTKDEIYMIDPATGFVIIIASAPGPYTRGITFANDHLWTTDFETNLIYQLKITGDKKFFRSNPEKHRVVYRHKVENFGPGTALSIDVQFALPENRANQELLSEINYNKTPEILVDQWGQKTAHFAYTNLKSGESAYSEMTVEFMTYDVRYFIFPEKTGSLDEIPLDIKNKYLKNNEKYQTDNPIIQQTVKEVVGNETNPYWIMRKINRFLIDHLHYLMDGAWDTAPTVITNTHGSCSEYTFTFIALCKAAGLPARYVGATWMRGEQSSIDDVFHRWPEVYLPYYGWIPVDPTRSDRVSPRDKAYPIGLLSNKALITTQSGGGSKTMEWDYNSSESFSTEPKTNLNIQRFADWEVVAD
ncbi:MAG: transglutaminase domain-containing protein [Bacteroidota bacterium]|nr:transglutaminase domain-containing protein [Bacteroidota bacterium]